MTVPKNLHRLLPLFLMCAFGLMLPSCFKDDDSPADQNKEWKAQNEQYVTDAMAKTGTDGTPYYTKISPSWAPETFVLVHWHNDRSLTENNLSPMDNSTTQIKYELFNIEGDKISDSYAAPDSVYTSRPSSNIIGMWAALTHMNVGDSVTLVIPSQAAYGDRTNSTIKPYSTLIYNVKLKAITAYEIP